MKTKTKLTIAVASVLSVVALAGTGYAGWVISKDASSHTQGNVTVSRSNSFSNTVHYEINDVEFIMDWDHSNNSYSDINSLSLLVGK